MKSNELTQQGRHIVLQMLNLGEERRWEGEEGSEASQSEKRATHKNTDLIVDGYQVVVLMSCKEERRMTKHGSSASLPILYH